MPCPVCDMERATCKPIMAMALGVALGDGLDQHTITELVCAKHRQLWVMAMCNAAVMVNTIDDEPEQHDEPGDGRDYITGTNEAKR